MNVFQICSVDYGCDLETDDLIGGNMIFASLKAAKAAVQQDEDALVDECNEEDPGIAAVKAPLAWSEDADSGEYKATSLVNDDLLYVIIRSKVHS